MRMKKKVRRILYRILIGLSVITAVVGSGAIAVNVYMDSMLNKLDHQESITLEEASVSDEMQEVKKQHNIVNFALFGCDNDDGHFDSDTDRSDAIKVISLDMDAKTIKIVNIERDVVVWFPGDSQQYGHFNWAYWYGGPKLAVQTLNYNLDLDITNYASFSFYALEQLVDLVGGVDIDLTLAEIYQDNKPLNISDTETHGAGVYTLNGAQAMAYCRIRFIDSDFSRVERQNNVIRAVLRKLKKMNPIEIMNVVGEMLPKVTTNFSNNEIKELALSIVSFDAEHMETRTEPYGEFDDLCTCPEIGGYLVRSYTGMVSDLHEFLYGEEYTPSLTVQNQEALTYERFGQFKQEKRE